MPVRKIPRRGARKNLSKFFSVKMNKRLWSESLAEEDYKYLLDFDSKVESFEEQPFRIRYVLDGKTRYYTPDMLVLTKDGRRLVVEVKPKSKVGTPKNDLLFRIVAALCEAEGHKFVVVTVEMIREQPRLNNVKALWKYARTRLHPQHQIYCRELFLTRETVTLGDVFEFFESKGVGKHVVYALLFWGALSFEVTKPLGIHSSIGCPTKRGPGRGKGSVSMPNHRLARGMQLTIRGRDYTIEKRLPNNEVQIKDVVTNEYSAKAESLLVELLFQGDAELLGDNRNQDFLNKRLEQTRVSDLTLFDEDDPRRPAFERRRSYVRGVMAEELTVFTEATLLPIIEKVGAALDEYPGAEFSKLAPPDKVKVLRKTKVQPSFSSVWKWVKRYRQSGGDERVLVTATKAQGNRRRKFSGRAKDKVKPDDQQSARVVELLNQSIAEVFMQEQRFTVQAVYDDLVVKIADENENRDPENQLPRPHINSVYKVINKLDDYEILKARYGERIANEKYTAYKQGPRPTRPLERVEMDHTKTDLFVIDPVLLLPIGRAYLTWMICVFTKMILGFYVSFTPPSSLSVMECLKHAIRPKTYVRRKYPNIRHEWEAYGIMERLVVDNAVEFHGKHLEEACRQLGCNIQYGKKGSPWYRASIERSIGTTNTQLLHQQPGTTFSDIAELADYDPKKNAVITLDTLDEIVHKYIIDVYQNSKHRGINDIPALRWKEGVRQWPPALPAKAADLDVLLSLIEYRTISHSGIELDTLFYNDDSLAMLRSQMKRGAKFAIRRNPSDISEIHVYDEKHDRYITVPAVDQDYTKGLTLWQHNVIKRYVRERLEKDVDIIALCRAKREIRDIVERDWAKVKTSRVRMARFRNEGVQNRREGIEPAIDEPKSAAELPGSVAGPLLLNAGDQEGDDYRSGVSDLGSAFDAHSGEGPDSSDTNAAATPAVAGGIVKGAKKQQRRSKRAKPNQAQPSASQTIASHNPKPGDITDEFSGELTLDQDDADWGTSYDLRAE